MPNEKSWKASASSRRKIAEVKFWQTVSSLYGESLDFTGFKYLGSNEPCFVSCVTHGPFKTKATYLVNGYGCPACGREKARQSSQKRRLGFDVFVAKAREVYGDLYTYPSQDYLSNKHKVKILCRRHGEFWQKPNAHLEGKGCPECANDGKRARNAIIKASTKDGLLDRLIQANPSWEYDISSFNGMAKNMRAICHDHGEFFSAPNNMLRNSGCRGCGERKMLEFSASRKLTTQQWIEKAKSVHGDRYLYCDTVYEPNGKMIVKCHKHGDFLATSDHIYQSNGCPRCSVHLSRGEDEIANLLKIYTPIEQRDRSIIAPFEIDILIPKHGLAIEYCGEYWHGHSDPDSERAGMNKHYKKYAMCAKAGIRLITVFESEWQNRRSAIKRILLNAIGKTKGKLMARKCTIGRPSAAEARQFFELYHPQGGNGNGEHYALYHKGKMVACMRFTFGANDRGDGAERVWTLSRYATRVGVSGGASRLFRAFLSEYEPDIVKSFSDNRYFGGKMYAALGFELEAELPPDYMVWSPKIGLRPKSHYQRKLIPQRLIDHKMADFFDPELDERTEAEMTYLMKCRRIYDCGKKRWVWRK